MDAVQGTPIVVAREDEPQQTINEKFHVGGKVSLNEKYTSEEELEVVALGDDRDIILESGMLFSV